MKAVIASILLSFSAPAFCGEMTDDQRREYLTLCFGNKGFNIQVDEADRSSKNFDGQVDDAIRDLPNEMKMEAYRRRQECALELRNSELEQPVDAYINTRDQRYVELYLRTEPIEYTFGILCRRPDILADFRLSQALMGKQASSELIETQLFGKTIRGFSENFDLTDQSLNCKKRRICEVRGRVPVEILTKTIDLYGTPGMQVKVLKGTCAGEAGFVNERFIDY